MTTFLVATASVHTTAAICDYLQDRVGPADTVYVVSVVEPTVSERDTGDAVNVARTRLVEPTVETVTRNGDPAEEIAALVAEHDVDEVLVGQRRAGPAETPGLGGTVADLLVTLSVPVVVVTRPED